MAASFDGPIVIPKIYDGHDKTFFYFTLEENRFPGRSFCTASVPTDAFRKGDFSSLLRDTVIVDPRNGQPFANNIIPANRISQVALNAQTCSFCSRMPAPPAITSIIAEHGGLHRPLQRSRRSRDFTAR